MNAHILARGSPERSGERAGCTVTATAHCLGIPVSEAAAKLAALGRKRNRGFQFHSLIAESLGLTTRPDLSCKTLASIWPELQQGRFIVKQARHVFAVIDGVAFDWRTPKPGLRVKMVYQKP